MADPPQSRPTQAPAAQPSGTQSSGARSSGAQPGPGPEVLLDVKGLGCPLPVLRANRTLRGMQGGERLRVLATDRAAIADFRAFCSETGHALVAFGEENGVLSFVIRRRAD